MKKYIHVIRSIGCLSIIFCFIYSTISIGNSTNITSSHITTEKITEITVNNYTMDDNYGFFSFAIIWGEFEILKWKHFLRGLYVYNPYPYNETMHVIGYVGFNGVGFIYKNASTVYCPWWLGFVRQHSLFVIGWGHSVQAW